MKKTLRKSNSKFVAATALWQELRQLILCVVGSCGLFFSLTAGENGKTFQQLKQENAQLRQELQELKARFAERENRWQQQELWLNILSDDAKMFKVSTREQRLLCGISEMVAKGNDLTLKSAELCAKLRALLDEIAIGASRRATMLILLDQTEKAAGKFSLLTDLATARNPMPRSCRVIAVNQAENLAVLSVGSLNGAVPGLIFRSADGRHALRIVAARPYICAAEPVGDNLELPAPGSQLACFAAKYSGKLLPHRD